MFHSKLHKQLYFNCDKIITSFSNLSNVSPFGAGPTRWYADLVKFELVYLQHGILHASLRSLYDKEHCSIDRVVVSSGFEIENFQKNYGFAERELIKSCMPRYDSMEPSGKRKTELCSRPLGAATLSARLSTTSARSCPRCSWSPISSSRSRRSSIPRDCTICSRKRSLSRLQEPPDIQMLQPSV